MDHWYFAYGSNMSSEQFFDRTQTIRAAGYRPRIACFADHRLAFNMLGDDKQVYANIVQPGDGALGVLYRCGQEALEKLDLYEDGYVRREELVIDDSGIALQAFLYIARPDRETAEGIPSAQYLAMILTGAREHNLPTEYIRKIKLRALG